MQSDRFGLTNRQAHPEMSKKTLNRRIASSNESLNNEESRNMPRGPNALQLRLPTDSTAEDLRQLQRTNDRRSQYNEFPSADGNSYVNNNMDVSSQRNGPLWSGQDGLWNNTNCAGMHNHEFATTNNAVRSRGGRLRGLWRPSATRGRGSERVEVGDSRGLRGSRATTCRSTRRIVTASAVRSR